MQQSSTMQESHRILDPIHGLIHFNKNDETDKLAWQLINSPAFQRLRRIKQLGFTEFVFPGASHSRFSHSVGVFHIARELTAKVQRYLGDGADNKKALAAQLAALLHDIGHGAFSHAFEKAEEKCGASKKHEAWTIEIIQNNEGLKNILSQENLLDSVVDMIDPQSDNLYHAIISSAFDADRLDYLQRDRYMCGIGSGGFDCAWMLDCLEVETDERFRLNEKSAHNAVEYLLARYHLHINVYTHKTIRAAEMMLSDILFALSEDFDVSGLSKDHPLKNYYQTRSVEAYLALNDITIWSALEQISRDAKTKKLKTLATNLLNRQFYKCFDVGALAEKQTDKAEGAAKLKAFIKALKNGNPNCVIDEAEIAAYPQQSNRNHDGIKIGKMDIVRLSPIIAAVPVKEICRVYAMHERDIDFAKDLWEKT